MALADFSPLALRSRRRQQRLGLAVQNLPARQVAPFPAFQPMRASIVPRGGLGPANTGATNNLASSLRPFTPPSRPTLGLQQNLQNVLNKSLPTRGLGDAQGNGVIGLDRRGHLGPAPTPPAFVGPPVHPKPPRPLPPIHGFSNPGGKAAGPHITKLDFVVPPPSTGLANRKSLLFPQHFLPSIKRGGGYSQGRVGRNFNVLPPGALQAKPRRPRRGHGPLGPSRGLGPVNY